MLEGTLRVQRVARVVVVEGQRRRLAGSHLAILAWRLIRQKEVISTLATHI